jgi:hypothetical protein
MELHTATLKTANARFGLVVTVEKITQTWRNRTEKATIAS